MEDCKDLRIQPWFVDVLRKCGSVYHDARLVVPQVDEVHLTLHFIGGILDVENRVLIEAIVLDEHLFRVALVCEESFLEVGEQQL